MQKKTHGNYKQVVSVVTVAEKLKEKIEEKTTTNC